MSFIFKGDLPEFFLIHDVMTEDGNVVNVSLVAANHRVSCYSISPRPDVPMAYAWSKDNESRPGWWMWTSKSKDEIEKTAKDRLEYMGYEPVVTVNPGTTGPEFHLYGKLNQHADLDSGCEYLEYIPGGKTYLPMGEHPSIMTYHSVYRMLGADTGILASGDLERHEYIIGFEHLHGRINDSVNPIDADAVLILTKNDTDAFTRSAVIMAAIDFGYNSSELRVLIDIMSEGRVVFDNRIRTYKIENLHTERHGYCRYAGKKLLTENEFYELLAYEVNPTIPINRIGDIAKACTYARNKQFYRTKDPLDIVPDFNLSWCN